MDNDVLDVEPVKNIIDATIEDEMQRSYIDYSMSVIVSRALPDVRDGLKPVQRRILYGMNELGLHYNKKEMKCARIVGEVMGKFHPHGDSSIYLALVRMAQSFSFRYPLIKGQGNFGNIDMGPAAMRYTEAKMQKMTEDILVDINKDTVDFRGNYDDTLQEPVVLPARIPNLLINGAQGIAVGLATLIPPHNITEVLNGVLALLEDPTIQIEGVKADIENGIEAKKGLIDYITAPDFPTGGVIYGYAGIKSMYLTGRGRVVVRGKVHYEESKRKGDKHRLVVDEIPYQVGRNNLIEKLIELHKDKKIDGIFDVINESGKNTRVVIELKKDANHEIITNLLFKYTQLQVSIGGNIVALVNGKPMQLNLKQILSLFISHREEVIIRRTQFELKKAKARTHILEGLKIAQDNIEQVIKVIRASKTVDLAKKGLIETFDLSDIQATAIVTMRLGQLTGLEIEKILNEIEELRIKIEDFEDILERKERRVEVIKSETIEVSEKYQDERKSEIVHYADDFTVEDMIPNDEMIVMISHQGYIKRVAATEFRTQNRGGIGSKGSASKDSDFIEFIFNASNHDYLMFFTDTGKVYWKKVWRLPEMSKQSKGRPIVNIIERVQGEKIKAVIKVTDFELDGKYLVMSTKNGIIKKTVLKAYARPNKGGIIAINLRDNDELLDVRITSGEDEIILGTRLGYANRFNETNVREVGRNSIGVKGINLRDGDEVVGMVVSQSEDEALLVVSENGYGKRSVVEAFRKTSRGSKGVRALNTTDKTGRMITLVKAGDESDLMIITSNGIVIKQGVENIRVMGRNTQGVRLISVRDKDTIADICITPKLEDESIVEEEAVIVETQDGNTEPLDVSSDENNTEIIDQNDATETVDED